MKLVYGVKDKPKFGQVLVFAFQQLLAILAATIAVPAIINQNIEAAHMSQSAALFGAGVGTLVYQLFTKFRSPVFLGSSFAFIGSMLAAFAGGVSMSAGYLGLILGAAMAGLVYAVIAIVVKIAGVKWINKLMPAAVIGPTVAIIGLSLAGNAVKDAVGASDALKWVEYNSDLSAYVMNGKGWIAFLCALVTLLTVVLCSVYGKKMMKLIPFIIGILAGYLVATIFTVIGIATGNETFKIINFSLFQNMQWVPDFSFLKAFDGNYNFGEAGSLASYILTIAVAYVPVAFVVFAEHLADHKNLSTIINSDLTEDPGLHRTLLGDGVGSFAGAFFGGCPNTTYGESVGCVAITGNASVITITVTAFMAIVAAFIAPFVTFLATIPACVMGGVCMTLYGFIAVSGLKMVQKVDLEDNRNLFVVSVILIAGIGGMALRIGQVTLTSIAVALILGIVLNLILSRKEKAE
ncbi:MAG: uracil-xanthine permease [Ruminococcaceae bacterium]|nr:uracil-xanthine permease [Oscillospiraceae bacterium]